MKLSPSLTSKLESLIKSIEGKKIIVAFSGGVDSSLLAFLCSKYAKETLAITIKSILVPEEEIDAAKHFAKRYNIPHLLFETDPLDDDQMNNNPPSRCYYCKKGIYSKLKSLMERKKCDSILDGSNTDDLKEHRPGMKAIKELGIITPYIDLEISKQDIRNLAKHFELTIHSKPSMACLASRIPYEEPITPKKLQMIWKAEKYLKKTFGLTQLRVRFHGDSLARIELLKDEMSSILNPVSISKINSKLKDLGFNYVALDMEGFRSGSMDEKINSK